MTDEGGISVPPCSGPCQPSPQLQLYQTIIFATPVIFALLLLILFCLLYIRRRQSTQLTVGGRMQFVARGFFPSPVHDHGLSKSFRERLPVMQFDERFAASSKENQCVVCLSEYEVNDKLLQLPVCKHSFHDCCIDAWLEKNTTCPICRSSLLQGENIGRGFIGAPEVSSQWERRVAINDFRETIQQIPAAGVVNVPGNSTDAIDFGNASLISNNHSINIERS
ncbi:hypothetical protein KP509_22G069900 [Ceratopteris richardii]|uniref:RING-type domain-containing protein n=1 Tax=Ceratopteris richardii TaxID=49495 RepID=A0A8T2S9F1_CERRI|nr:hypothetical protein KP509_22G069900 [Ceratopteris richardii]